jgi:hypothetical protein
MGDFGLSMPDRAVLGNNLQLPIRGMKELNTAICTLYLKATYGLFSA